MNNLIHRVLMAYRPMYLRGLLMDGQYRLPKEPEKPSVSGQRVIHLTPVFQPDRRRVLVATATAAAVGLCARSTLPLTTEPATQAADASSTHPRDK